MNRKWLWLAALLAAFAAAPAAGQEGPFPNRRLTVIVPYNAGATPDIIARLVGPKLAAALGQPVVIINRTGAGSNIGTRAIITSPPDGYTFGIVGNPQTIHHLITKEPSYVFARDVTAITNAASGFYALTVNPQRLDVNSVPELIARAKANPGKLQFGSGGINTSPHLVGEWFNGVNAINTLHVPYGGTDAFSIALLRGEIDFAFSSPVYVAQNVKAGKIRALAVTTPQRDPVFFPDLPTLKELGIDLVYEYWIGFVGPAGMPDPVTQRLAREIAAILKNSEVKDALARAGLTAVGDTAEHFKATIDNETRAMARIIEGARLAPK